MMVKDGVIEELHLNIVKMSTAHPAGEVVTRNLRVDFKGMPLADFLTKVVEPGLRVAIQNRRIKTEPTIESARTWTNKTVSWKHVYGEKKSVVVMTDKAVVEMAKGDPEYRRRLIEALLEMDKA